MTMTPIWNVRGVRLETRQKAKAAAAWTGMTIGEWVDRAVGVMAEDDLHTKASGGIGPAKIAGGEVESEKVPGVTRQVFTHTEGELAAALAQSLEATLDGEKDLPEFLQGPEAMPSDHHVRGSHDGAPCDKCYPEPGYPKTRIIDAVPDKPKKGRPAKTKGEKKKAAKCAHGVASGINCWRCGGKAVIE